MTLKEMTNNVVLVAQRYAKRHEITQDADWHMFKLQEEVGELTQQFLMLSGRARKKGLADEKIKENFEEELADVFGHTLLLAKYFNIDLKKSMKKKWFNYLD